MNVYPPPDAAIAPVGASNEPVKLMFAPFPIRSVPVRFSTTAASAAWAVETIWIVTVAVVAAVVRAITPLSSAEPAITPSKLVGALGFLGAVAPPPPHAAMASAAITAIQERKTCGSRFARHASGERCIRHLGRES